MLSSIITAYFYLIFSATFSTIVLILFGKSWGNLPHKYLKLIEHLQSYFTADGVVLGSIERTKTGTRRWLFGRSQLSTTDDILDESADELLLDSGARAANAPDDASSGGSDFEHLSGGAATSTSTDAASDSGRVGGLAGAGLTGSRGIPALAWHLELLRDGIESVIQDEISDIFAQSAAYRNAEPRSLRDLFFHYSRERKRRRRRLQVQKQRALEQKQRQRIQQQNIANLTKVNRRQQQQSSAIGDGVEVLPGVVPEEERFPSEVTSADAVTARTSSSSSSVELDQPAPGSNAKWAAADDEPEDPPLRFRPFLRSCLLLLVSRVFRVGILFPIRVGIFTSSFVFLFLVCLSACFIDYSPQKKTHIAVIYCRLFTAGTGLVARYHNPENRPRRPGVAVSNHLSPNDIQIICADVETTREYLYILTGQKHHGIIWTIERLVERMCPSIWLERSSVEDRKHFTNQVLNVARETGPILIFPEGYCTNNQKVLQFRRAVFDEGIIIYPIAIRQDARFGDSYWSEKHFFSYLLRILTAWAIVYDVYYLPSRIRRPDQTSTEFASAVQGEIADRIGLECANFDAGLFYKQSEREKYRKLWNAECAKRIQTILARAPPPPPSSITSDGVTSTDGTEDPSDASFLADTVDKLDVNSLRPRAKSASLSSNLPPTPSSQASSLESLKAKANEPSVAVTSRPEGSDSEAEVTVEWSPVDTRVLRRRRYNSLHVLKRQFSSGVDDNSDNAQLRG